MPRNKNLLFFHRLLLYREQYPKRRFTNASCNNVRKKYQKSSLCTYYAFFCDGSFLYNFDDEESNKTLNSNDGIGFLFSFFLLW